MSYLAEGLCYSESLNLLELRMVNQRLCQDQVVEHFAASAADLV
jgi:hypothetical protein